MKQEIHKLLEQLKFKGMAEILDQQIALAESGTSIQNIICNILKEELRYRQERNLINRIRSAKMPWDWTLNSFPFELQPGVNKNQIMTLAGLDFLERGENIILHGKTGVGKSGLAVGILRQALISGCRGRFYDVQRLLDDLYASLADRSTTKLLNALCRYDILLLDELGYLTLNKEQMNAFFKLMKERYEAGKSTIITTNLEPENWYHLLKPKDMVDALLDRLYHRCVVIKIDGQSLRGGSSE
jgi:DNA replication protein DnaC